METLSFVLGIASVVVIAVAIVAVYAFVKVSKLEQGLSELQTRINYDQSHVYKDMNDQFENVYRNIESRHDNLIAIMDSRMDKLENKLITKK